MKLKNDVIVVATHHGAFMTLQSVLTHRNDFQNIYVVVPESQIQKYAAMDKTAFKNFHPNLDKYVSENFNTEILIVDDSILKNPFTSVFKLKNEFKQELNNNTLVLYAGALYVGGMIEHTSPNTASILSVVMTRKYAMSKNYNMYHMIGLNATIPIEQKYNSQMFFVNFKNVSKLIMLVNDKLMFEKITKLPETISILKSEVFGRYDPLVETAIPQQRVLKEGRMSTYAHAFQYWSQSMTNPDDMPIERLYHCPFDMMLDSLKPIWRYLPKPTYDRIKQNAKDCVEIVSDLRALSLT